MTAASFIDPPCLPAEQQSRVFAVLPFNRTARRALRSFAVLILCRCSLFAAHYYVDGMGGADANPGTLQAPWQTLHRVNSFRFVPGDVVSFKCGSGWRGRLLISRSGAAGRPILFNAFGSGEKPLFKNPGGGAYGDAIAISGSNIVLDGVQTDTAGFAGVNIMHGADHNVVRNCEVRHAGMSIEVYGRYNLVTHNYVHHPHMVVNTPGGDDDYGADGITCWNSYNEVSWNRIDSCYAPSYDYGEDGGGLGIYGGENNENVDSCYYHHNVVVDCDGMTEIGSSGGYTVHGFVEAYNVYINTHSGAAFLVLHLDGTFRADVQGMRFENNTVYCAHPVFEYDDCLKWGTVTAMTPGILTLTNNIFVTGNYSSFMASDHPGSPGLSHNVFWSVQGVNNVGKAMDATDIFADPRLVSLGARDLLLQASSPAINRGTALAPPPSMFVDPRVDADARPVVGAPDAGAYEYQSSPSSAPPTAVTSSATNITETGALLNGSVNPNGSSTTYHFDIGLTGAYGVSAPVSNAGSGSVAVGVSSTVSSLSPGTVYHYRLVVTSSAGSSAGADRTFTTAGSSPAPLRPAVSTSFADGITMTGARIHGYVNPNGYATSSHFEYGLTGAYGSSTPVGNAGSGIVPLSVDALLAGLRSGSLYHYRLVAANSGGTVAGSDSTFSTEPGGNAGAFEACILNQNYPNPFNPATAIDFELRVAGYATLRVYNALGVEVCTLFSGPQSAGKHTLQWNAKGMASGVYICTLQSGGTLAARRMLLLK